MSNGKEDEKNVIVYTKGSGENKDGEYGWAYALYMNPEYEDDTDPFRTEMHAVLDALKAMDKSVSVEIRTNNEAVSKICEGEYKADKSKDLYDEFIELKKCFEGSVHVRFISLEERDTHFDEVRKMARNEVI